MRDLSTREIQHVAGGNNDALLFVGALAGLAFVSAAMSQPYYTDVYVYDNYYCDPYGCGYYPMAPVIVYDTYYYDPYYPGPYGYYPY